MGGRCGAEQTVDTAGAEKKLRQAEFFLGYLDAASRDTAYQHGNPLDGGERLEFFFSACLSAARSVFYVLEKNGGTKFKETQRRWRAEVLKEDVERFKFNRMVRLRDGDVHFGTIGAEALQKWVEEDWRNQNRSSYYYQPDVYNAALFGPRPVIEEVNPDGATVRATVLRGSVGLYIEQHSQRVEATTACREFISQLRSLLHAVKAGEVAS